jgi:hypothetical protein
LQFGETLEELQERMSSEEFTRWIAYNNIEPFGYPMDRLDVGIITSQIVNAVHASIPMPKGKRRPKPLSPSDFAPQTRNKREPDLTPEQRAHIRKKHGKRKPKDAGDRV